MTDKKFNILIARAGYAPLMAAELASRFKTEGKLLGEDALIFSENKTLPKLENQIFARQYLPHAIQIPFGDQQRAVEDALKRVEVAAKRPNRQTGQWTLHAVALEDNEAKKLSAKLEKALLARIKEKIPGLAKRYIAPDELVKRGVKPSDFVIQFYVPNTESLWLSIGSFSSGISPYIGGNLRMRHKEGAPSRSARKIEEAYLALGRMPKPGETAVDLGAAPGGWTFSLARRGAEVIAVDAADLDLPKGKAFTENVTHVRDNGLFYQPPGPVDWLVCDMVVAPRETLRVLSHWLKKDWMRNFIVNLKLPKANEWQAIEDALKLMSEYSWPVMKGRHLYHDRWEITLVGSKGK